MATKTNTDTNTNTNTNTDDSASNFQPQHYAQFLRSASANRAATFAQLYITTLTFASFRDHAERIVLAFSTANGVDTTTISLLALIDKLPKSAYEGIEAKAKLNVQSKPSLKLDEEFAKLLIQFLSAFATVSKYCKVS